MVHEHDRSIIPRIFVNIVCTKKFFKEFVYCQKNCLCNNHQIQDETEFDLYNYIQNKYMYMCKALIIQSISPSKLTYIPVS